MIQRTSLLIKMAIGLFVSLLLFIALCPSPMQDVRRANLNAVGIRGRDIWFAIASAHEGNEPLPDQSLLWPTDDSDLQKKPNFTNSTDYFRWLIDEPNMGCETRWQPHVNGFGYCKLAGAKVTCCTNAHLEAMQNMWTIIKNYHQDLPAITPVLITRNIDPTSLTAKMTEKDMSSQLRFDHQYKTPFGSKDFVIIRKSGEIYFGRASHLTYRDVYGGTPFDATIDKNGRPLQHPLKYLSPSREVTTKLSEP